MREPFSDSTYLYYFGHNSLLITYSPSYLKSYQKFIQNAYTYVYICDFFKLPKKVSLITKWMLWLNSRLKCGVCGCYVMLCPHNNQPIKFKAAFGFYFPCPFLSA